MTTLTHVSTSDWPDGHWATAPYTAIPFPTIAMGCLVDLARIRHDRLDPGLLHGWIAVTATTKTALFCGVTDTAQTPASVTAEPGSPQWIIPGTTMTGMLRNTIRMITGSRLPAIDPTPLFQRHPFGGRNDPLRNAYQAQGGMVLPPDRNDRVAIGFLNRTQDGGLQVEVVAAAPQKVRSRTVLDHLRQDLPMSLPDLPDPARDPQAAASFRPNSHPVQGRLVTYLPGDRSTSYKVPAVADGTRPDAATRLNRRRGNHRGQALTGYVYLTGIAGTARTAAYIWPDVTPLDTLAVPDHILAWFDTDNQITAYQSENFTSANPGALAASLSTTTRGQPVWIRYIPRDWTTKDLAKSLDGATLVAIGRSGGFRVPAYRKNPLSHTPGPARTVLAGVPEDLLHHTQPDAPARVTPGHSPTIQRSTPSSWAPDAVQAMFGDIDLPKPWPAQLARRVRCSTLVAEPGSALDPAQSVTLLSPRPSCFLHYLDQPDNEDGIVSWSHSTVTVRGYKAYLHRTPTTAGPEPDPDAKTSRTIQPVTAGTRFHGRITFSNLTREELGLLLAAIDLDNGPHGGPRLSDPNSCHKLGQGRSLGLGSIHLNYQLHLIDPHQRYGHDPFPHDPANSLSDPADYRAAARSVLSARPEGYRDVLKASQWRHRLSPEHTASMPLDHTDTQPGFDQMRPLPPLASLWPEYTPSIVADPTA